MRERGAAVGRSRETNISRAAAKEPPRLEGRDDGGPDCERIRFDLRLVLAAGIGVDVVAYLNERVSRQCRRDRRQRQSERAAANGRAPHALAWPAPRGG